MVSVRGVTKVYRGSATPALKGLDLSVREGEVLGLLGPNGAGKTTAISILTTAMAPTEGQVSIGGLDILKYPIEARSLLGVVPQEIALYPSLTTRENLQYFGRLYGMRGALLRDRIAECLQVVGLQQKADEAVSTYSGGMKRRANLAAGILHSPAILFLDEPTVGIDAQSRGLILERLLHLRDTGTTIIYTTHYMEEAAMLCSSVAIIDEGRKIAEGPPNDLVRDSGGCTNLEGLFFSLTGKHLRD